MIKEATTYTIDAKDARLGKVAAQAAARLMGKDRTDFVRYSVPNAIVKIVNAGQAAESSRKMKGKVYVSYSGYPAGLKRRTMQDVAAKRGRAELFRRAVKGMLPKNKLQAVMMRNLKIEE